MLYLGCERGDITAASDVGDYYRIRTAQAESYAKPDKDYNKDLIWLVVSCTQEHFFDFVKLASLQQLL